MRNKILIATILLLFSIASYAQRSKEIVLENERDTWFYFIAYEYKKKPMIAFISSYIFRNKFNYFTSGNTKAIETIIHSGMNDALDNQIDPNYTIAENGVATGEYLGSGIWTGSSHWDGINASGFPEPEHKYITKNTYQSTTSYIIAGREGLIQDLKNKGYSVYQIDFKEDYLKVLQEREYLDAVEHIERLSTLIVPIYQRGDFEGAYDRAKENEEEKNGRTKIVRTKTNSSNRKSENRESNFSSYCFGLRYDIIQKYQYYKTQSNQINQPLVTRQMLLEKISNYQNECPAQASTDNDIKNIYNELNVNIVEGLASVPELFTSSPWSIGYGRFLDSKNETYLIRLGLGFATADYEGTFVKLSWQANSNFLKLPARSLIYKFQADDGMMYDHTTKSEEIDDLKGFMVSLGPTLTFWPHKNIFLQIAPEIYGGFLSSKKDENFPIISAIPGGDAKLGLRLGKVYLSGSYGMLLKKFNLNNSSDYKSEDVTQDFNGTPVKGIWVADNYDHNKWLKHKFWQVSLGFNF